MELSAFRRKLVQSYTRRIEQTVNSLKNGAVEMH